VSAAEALLARLDGVQRSGCGWRANCPNGHSKARGSIAITEADDGRVLLHCFACSDTPAILAAIGMEVADLYPERIRDSSPQGRQAARAEFQRSAWRAALGVLAREASIVLCAARMLRDGHALPACDIARLALATDRIESARRVLV
jgi:hypothetical protein